MRSAVLILRPIEMRDLDDLVALADMLDSMNLPSDRGFLHGRVDEFRRTVPSAGEQQRGVYP